MYVAQVLISRLESSISGHGTSSAKALEESGAGKDMIANLKKGQTPTVSKIHAIADYLDCSVDYLLGRTDKPEINR